FAWEPASGQLAAPPLRFLLEHWLRLSQDIGLPLARKIDPFELKPALGYIMLLEPVAGDRDFCYRLYGSRIADISGFDMTGKLLSEHPASTYATELGIAVYRAVVRRRRPLYTTRNPVGGKFARRWHRLILPFADASGSITRLLCGTVAIGVDGRLI
ncbi:MAG: PAS domain-containing protein, partial [Proteobacteria bacterium]|nr:PAS domain-containing protein [Pseudomonadota bacterium]